MATYYVIGAGGSDSNDGSNDTTQGWATIDHAMNTVVADDTVYVKATGTYSETPVIDTAGGVSTPIIFEGYGTTPGDNAKVTVTGTTNCLTSALTSAAYNTFKNFIFTGASGDGVSMVNTDSIRWINCEFSSNGGDGIFCDNEHLFVNCEAIGNTNNGFDHDNDPIFIGCIGGNNGGVQIYGLGSSAPSIVYKCVAYGSTGSSNAIQTSANFFASNTVDGENVAGYGGYANATPSLAVDNIIYDCAVGLLTNSAPRKNNFYGYNLLNSNTTDYSNASEATGFGDVTGAPAFTSEAGDDYTLGEASPAIGAGLTPGGIT